MVGFVLMFLATIGLDVLWFYERERRKKIERELKAVRENRESLIEVLQKQKDVIEKMEEAIGVQKEYALLLEKELELYKSFAQPLSILRETLSNSRSVNMARRICMKK